MTLLVVHEQIGRGSSVLVLLPGAYMRAQEFLDAEFMHAVSHHDLSLDIQIVDIDFVHTAPAVAQSSVCEQVLMPAREKYERLFVGGISLGGQSALLHAATGNITIDGLCLIAPYPGSRLAMNEIERSGGLGNWHPSAEQIKDSDYKIWNWLRQPRRDILNFVGYGEQDRFVDGMDRLARQLCPDTVCTVPGGHDWGTWKHVWRIFLESGAFLH